MDGEYINYCTISSCTFAPTPDLPLPTEIYENFEADLDTIVGRFSDEYLGETPATLTELAIADSQYSALNINVINNEISGDLLGNFSEVAFLKIYAKD